MEKHFKNVWLIDDNEIDNFINKKTIMKCNFAENVTDFRAALQAEEKINELMETGDKENFPDLILLDLNMPVFSGLDFLNRCENKLLEMNPELKLIILTSSINPNDEYLTSTFKSFKAFLNKPLNAHNLTQLAL